MKISSPAFMNGGKMPARFAYNHENYSPPLTFSEIPPNAQSLALIMDDPDAVCGTWVHWVMWNISPQTTGIPEDSVPDKAVEGVTNFRGKGYGGPCPPSGIHRYFFKLYALDTVLNFDDNSTASVLEEKMKDHIIEQAELYGLYSKT